MKVNPGERKSLEELLEIIERNRQENLLRKREAYEGLYSAHFGGEQQDIEGERSAAEQPLALGARDVKVVIFGADSPFSSSLIAMLSRMTVVCCFNHAEKAINFCLEYGIGGLIIDLDAPTDVHVAMDVYFALTILNPAMKILLCTKSIISLEARTLHAKGAELFQKPFLRIHAEELVHGWLA